jgi:hypothetical protein
MTNYRQVAVIIPYSAGQADLISHWDRLVEGINYGSDPISTVTLGRITFRRFTPTVVT